MRTNSVNLSRLELKKFRASLLHWYEQSRRDLPWRKTRDPYGIWVSEMMLQQTRVAAVLDYYERFLRKFPDVHALARAQESEVLAAWSGLGYYRRARAMHAAAKQISEEFDGQFPKSASELERLPGIGRYTAAAISSIAFGGPNAVVDGNVERVLSRVLGKHLRGRQEAWAHAEEFLDPTHPGDWNQAVMELGATTCLPADPKCLFCPVRKWCKEPGREVKKLQAPRGRKKLLYGLAQRRGSVYLVRRPEKDSLMAGMWELPQIRTDNGSEVLHRTKHSITNNDYEVSVYVLASGEVTGGKWIRREVLQDLALTGLARKILRATNLWPTAGI